MLALGERKKRRKGRLEYGRRSRERRKNRIVHKRGKRGVGEGKKREKGGEWNSP